MFTSHFFCYCCIVCPPPPPQKKVVDKDVAHKGYPHNYIEKLWDNMYLEGRWSLPINSNPYLALKPPPEHAAVPPGSDPQITGAVRSVHVAVG